MVRRRNKGYSMIELILTLAITSIVSVSIYSLMSFGHRLFLRSEHQIMLTEQLGSVLTEVSAAVREAETIEISDDGADYRVLDSEGVMVMSIVFDIDSSRLTINSVDASLKTVENISDFQIAYSNGASVGRSVDVYIAGSTRYAKMDFSVTVTFRNREKFAIIGG